MKIQPIQTQPKRNNAKLLLATATGAGVGAVSRYVLPTKAEFKSIINKEAVDTFVSNSAAQTRGASRSVLKYAGVGAILAGGLTLLSRVFTPKVEAKEKENTQYTKLGALIDAPDYACEIMWYNDED